MKKLLLSVVALMVATLLFSLQDSSDTKEGISQDEPVEIAQKVEAAS